MKKLIILILISNIILSCSKKSPEAISEKYATHSIQSITKNIENEIPKNEPLPTVGNMTVQQFATQYEFNAYEYSQNIRYLFNTRGYILEHRYYPLELSAFVAFSKEDLRLLREELEKELQRGFGPSILSEDHLNNAYIHNINILTVLEKNFPNENEINSKLCGLWCLAYQIPDHGYLRGDYLKLYNNGIFEYIYRNFEAIRYRNQIYGGSRFGLWTTDTKNEQEYDIEYLTILEINEPDERLWAFYSFNNYEVDKIIFVFNDNWMKISDDIVNIKLDWGYKY
jgi:hypothetical protein